MILFRVYLVNSTNDACFGLGIMTVIPSLTI
jgi:hypothetical protein